MPGPPVTPCLSRLEVETLLDHVERMWDAEQDTRRRLMIRGRVIIASTSGLLGFVAIGLIVAGSEARMSLLPTGGWSTWAKAGVYTGTFGIAFGLLWCIAAVFGYIRHREEDAGILESRTDFGWIGHNYWITQPNIWSVSPRYLFKSVMRHERGTVPRFFRSFKPIRRGLLKGMVIKHRLTRRQGARDAARARKLWSARRLRQDRPQVRLFVRAVMKTVASWRVWYWSEYAGWCVLNLLRAVIPVPGFRQSPYVRRAIDAEYLREVEGEVGDYLKRNRRVTAATKQEMSALKPLQYPTNAGWSHRGKQKRVNKRHPRVLVTESSYYLQFAEAFAYKNLGRPADCDDPLDRKDPPVGYSELDPHTLQEVASSPAITPIIWRSFMSTYFTAQQQRSKNWNLWYRVRRSERIFCGGIVIIGVSFALVALAGEYVRENAPQVAPVDVRLLDGDNLEIRQAQPSD